MSFLIARYEADLEEGGHHADTTIHDRIRCLRRLHRDLPLGWVLASQEQLRIWLRGPKPSAHRRGWSPATKATYWEHLAAGYAWLVETGQRPDNPMTGIRRTHVPEKQQPAATDDQTAVALTAPEPLLTAVVLATYQGIRRAEACGMDREDITEEETRIHAKGGDTQVMPTHPAVWAHVRDKPPGPLIADDLGERYTAPRLGGLAHRWFSRHIGPGFGLHHLRRRLGKLVRKMTHDLRLTQVILRHKRIDTTARHYTEVEGDEARTALHAVYVVTGEASQPVTGSPHSPASHAA